MSTETPKPEPLDVPAEYGLSELGSDHMSLDQVMRRFGDERSWWMVTVRPDGRPHAVPVWGLLSEGELIFSIDPNSTKAKNIAAGSEIVLHLESGDAVAIVEGSTQTMTHDELPAGYGVAYNEKYDVEIDFSTPGIAIYKVVPTKVFSWDESAFVETAVRWRYR